MWSSIFLFGAMRPTNRKLTSPSSRISSSAGRDAACVTQVVVNRQRVELRVVPHRAEQRTNASSAVANRIAFVRRRHPLIDDHRNVEFGIRNSEFVPAFQIPHSNFLILLLRRKRLINGRAIHAQLLQLLRRVELTPEVEGYPRVERPRLREDIVDEPEQRAREVLRSQAIDRGELAVDDAI